MGRRHSDSQLLSQDREPTAANAHHKLLAPLTSSLDNEPPSNWLDGAVEYVNDHLRAFRRVPWVLATIGVFLVVRYTGMSRAQTSLHVHGLATIDRKRGYCLFRRFRCVSDIPEHLIGQNSRVMGVVASTNGTCVGVWHVPIGRRLLRWGLRPPEGCSSEELLNVQFAGVAIAGKEVTQWLRTYLLGRWVWLTLLHRSDDPPALQCVVHARSGGLLRRRYCVNEALLSAGMGSLGEAPGFKHTEDYAKLMHTLGRAEQAAMRRGRGIWQGEAWWQRVIKRVFSKPD